MVSQWTGSLPGAAQQIFAPATAASANLDFTRPEGGGALTLRLDLSGFSGTIDIQGRPAAASDYANIEYAQEAATLDYAIAQLSFTTITANRNYIVPNPPPFLRVVMTRSAGTIEGYADFARGGAGGGSSETAIADQGTKTATATNGWLVTPYTPLGQSMADDTADAHKVIVVGAAGATAVGGTSSLDVSNVNPVGSLPAVIGIIGRSTNTTRAMSSAEGPDNRTPEVFIESVSAALNSSGNADRLRNNLAGTLLASAARTATTSSADQTNYNGQAVAVSVNVTVVPGIETLTVTIEAKDPVSGTYTAVLTSTAIVATGMVRLRVGTDITAVANLAAADVLGRTWRVTVTPSASGSFTYSVGYDVMTA